MRHGTLAAGSALLAAAFLAHGNALVTVAAASCRLFPVCQIVCRVTNWAHSEAATYPHILWNLRAGICELLLHIAVRSPIQASAAWMAFARDLARECSLGVDRNLLVAVSMPEAPGSTHALRLAG